MQPSTVLLVLPVLQLVSSELDIQLEIVFCITTLLQQLVAVGNILLVTDLVTNSFTKLETKLVSRLVTNLPDVSRPTLYNSIIVIWVIGGYDRMTCISCCGRTTRKECLL